MQQHYKDVGLFNLVAVEKKRKRHPGIEPTQKIIQRYNKEC